MIQQQDNQLVLTFPSPEAARAFAQYLATLLQSGKGISVPPSESESPSQEPRRSQHVVLTPERQEQLFNQRQSGQSTHQRILRAQTTLRDGTLPFKQLSAAPLASGQTSPRVKAQSEGGFADGQPVKTKLRPAQKP
jgi:hypothetical protein